MRLSCFIIHVSLVPGLQRIEAGTTMDQAENEDEWYTLRQREPDRRGVLVEILGKLKEALEKGKDAIEVNTSGRIILKTPSSEAPSPASKVPSFGAHTTLIDVSKEGVEVTTSGKVILKTPAVEAAAPTQQVSATLVNLNKATVEELSTLPGVGPATAPKIVAGRPYKSVDDLVKIDGIGEAKMADIKPRATV